MPGSRDSPVHATRLAVGPPRLSTRHRRFQDSSLWQDPRLYEAPERDQQLTGEGHNPQLAQSGTAMPKPPLIPLGQGTGRLKATPRPSDLDRHGPYVPIARFGDALFATGLATLIRRRS